MTEDEARQKRCPINGIAAVMMKQLLAAHGIDSGVSAKCMASDCMCWRYESGQIDTQGKAEGERVLKDGYCGLAGKP